MTENQMIKYLERIVRLCAAHKANPNHNKSEVEEIRIIASHIIAERKKAIEDDITGAPV